jgi:hypothetical protein
MELASGNRVTSREGMSLCKYRTQNHEHVNITSGVKEMLMQILQLVQVTISRIIYRKCTLRILWHADPLLVNDSETDN